MKLTLQHEQQAVTCDTRNASSIAITLDFSGPQPNHFGTEQAKEVVLKLGSFTGDTSVGGSCNVDTLSMIPHCNGTHTETISHIVNEDIWIGHAAMDSLMVAVLISVRPVPVSRLSIAEKKEVYRPQLDADDQVVTAKMLESGFKQVSLEDTKPTALVIRTLPNDADKKTRAYGEKFSPAFFTVDAMQSIIDAGVQHLLVDLPSVDRMYDDGLLTNHHLFWNVPEETHSVAADSRQDKTITEMVYVDDDLKDGLYVLNLQIPAFGSDAAPSRPMLFPATFESE